MWIKKAIKKSIYTVFVLKPIFLSIKKVVAVKKTIKTTPTASVLSNKETAAKNK